VHASANNTQAYAAVYASPLGRLGIGMVGEALSVIDFLPPATPEAAPCSAAAERCILELARYFDDPAHGFTLALAPAGTLFQRTVWRALRAIPAGTVVTYGELGARVGSGPRAVGGACRANPIPIVVPCHRVVSSAGLGGYNGATAGGALAIKGWLLAHEGLTVGS
jgi:methylated-DNA-[protein]-cysteine S-methyltransferase